MIVALVFIISILIAYLSGSICSAVLVCRLFDLPDPRLHGSKNPGATNVLRLAGKKYAAFVLITDMLKGFLPVLFAQMMGGSVIIVGWTCFAAVFGHMYPVFFDFKGGKGVATALGALLAFNFMLGVMVIATWAIIANFSKHSSLASIASFILAPIYSLFTFGSQIAVMPLMCISIFIVYKHRDNISRLINGTESTISFHHKKHLAPIASNDAEHAPITAAKVARVKKASATLKKTAPTKKTVAAKTPVTAKKKATTVKKKPSKPETT